MRLTFAATALICAPAFAFAAGSESETPPTPTETTETCEEGQVFDLATQTCMAPEESTNDDSAMMDTVRELSYAGRLVDARAVLDLLDPGDSMVQTYYGFTARKMGDVEAGMLHYAAALEIDPDNNLARSYMGQGLVEAGDFYGAHAQLREIRARDGRQTWPEVALRMAIDSGAGPSY